MLKLKKFIVKTIIFMLLFMCVFNNDVKAEEDIYMYTDDYSIEYFLKNYNVVTLGTRQPNSSINGYDSNDLYGSVKNLIHIVGPIIVEGNLGEIDDQLYHSQFVQGISSYIKGEILSSGGAGGSAADGTNPPLYVGTINNVEQPYPPQFNYHINGFNWYTTYETIKTDYYIDFQKLYDEIIKQQEKIALGETITKDVSGNIYIKTGGIYTIDSLEGVNTIIFDEFVSNQDELTLINILDKGNDEGYIKFPRVVRYNDGNFIEVSTNDYYGKNGDTNEVYKGNIVWNVLNASYIEMDKSPFIGHFVAPQADVKMPEMHFAGCFIVNSLYGSDNTEGHMYSLDNNIELPIDLIIDDDKDDSINPDENIDNDGTNNGVDNDGTNNGVDNDNTIVDSESDNISDSGSANENDNYFENPNTLDSITIYIMFICISVIVILTSYLVYKKVVSNRI